MKKYLLPLILIFLLSFTLTGFCWVAGYDQRIKLTIDHTKIDAGLSDFPTMVKLTTSNFDFDNARLDGYDIRFTEDDGETLLKYEREHHFYSEEEEQCTIATGGNEPQGLTADSTYFYWGCNEGASVDGKIYKTEYDGTATTSFAAPEHVNGLDIRVDHENLICAGYGGETWEISKTGTKIREWDFSALLDGTYTHSAEIAYKAEDTIYYLVFQHTDYDDFKVYEITINDNGTYSVVDTWTSDGIGVPQGLVYKDGCLLMMSQLDGNTIHKLTLNEDDTITSEIMYADYDADSYYAEGITWIGDNLYYGKNDNKIHKLKTQLGIYHVKIPTVSNTVDTDFYMYYGDADAVDGSDKTNVWDSNFKAVYHMGYATPLTISDSTSNNNDGTKVSETEPRQATGKVGLAQDFDGTDDFIKISDSASLDITSEITLECLINQDFISTSPAALFLDKHYDGSTRAFQLKSGNPSTARDEIVFRLGIADGSDSTLVTTTDLSLSSGNWYHIAGTLGSDNTMRVYKNGVVSTDTLEKTDDIGTNNEELRLGIAYNELDNEYPGLMDEVRISSVGRSAGWIKATYNSLLDTLLTYGTEELAGIIWNGIRITKWNGITITKINGK